MFPGSNNEASCKTGRIDRSAVGGGNLAVFELRGSRSSYAASEGGSSVLLGYYYYYYYYYY
jgi:hypothetical protein